MAETEARGPDAKRADPGAGHKKRGLAHVYWALVNSLDGLRALTRETAFWHENVLGTLGGILAWFALPFTVEQALLLTVLWMLVYVVEILNTAVETVVDLVSPEHHALAKKAKDLGSAAVAAIMVCNIVAWAVLLWNMKA